MWRWGARMWWSGAEEGEWAVDDGAVDNDGRAVDELRGPDKGSYSTTPFLSVSSADDGGGVAVELPAPTKGSRSAHTQASDSTTPFLSVSSADDGGGVAVELPAPAKGSHSAHTQGSDSTTPSLSVSSNHTNTLATSGTSATSATSTSSSWTSTDTGTSTDSQTSSDSLSAVSGAFTTQSPTTTNSFLSRATQVTSAPFPPRHVLLGGTPAESFFYQPSFHSEALLSSPTNKILQADSVCDGTFLQMARYCPMGHQPRELCFLADEEYLFEYSESEGELARLLSQDLTHMEEEWVETGPRNLSSRLALRRCQSEGDLESGTVEQCRGLGFWDAIQKQGSAGARSFSYAALPSTRRLLTPAARLGVEEDVFRMVEDIIRLEEALSRPPPPPQPCPTHDAKGANIRLQVLLARHGLV